MINEPAAAAHGFTLIELMIVVAIVAISMVIAAPNIQSFVADQHVRVVASDLAQDIAFARASAISSSKNTVIQPLIVGNWMSGWMTYTDNNTDGAYTAGTDILLKQTTPTSGTLKICLSGAAPEFLTNIIFRPDGSVVRITAVTANDGLMVSDQGAANFIGKTNSTNFKIRSLYFGPSGRVSVVEQNTGYNTNAAVLPCP